MTKKFMLNLAASVSLISPMLAPIPFMNTAQFSQIAQAAENNQLQKSPQKEFYIRGENIEFSGRFKPNVPVKIIESYKHERTGQNEQRVLAETTSNSEGIASIKYQVPLDALKDDVHIIFEGPRRTYNTRIPIGSTPKPQPPKPVVNFPIKVSSPETKVGNKDYMQSDITLSLNPSGGLLYGVTRTWTKDKWTGFTGGVEVVLLDESDNYLYISQLRKYGVNGTWIPGAPDSRTSTWNESISADVMRKAKKVAIVHRHTPTPRLPGLFANIKDLVEFIKPLIQVLGTGSPK